MLDTWKLYRGKWESVIETRNRAGCFITWPFWYVRTETCTCNVYACVALFVNLLLEQMQTMISGGPGDSNRKRVCLVSGKLQSKYVLFLPQKLSPWTQSLTHTHKQPAISGLKSTLSESLLGRLLEKHNRIFVSLTREFELSSPSLVAIMELTLSY